MRCSADINYAHLVQSAYKFCYFICFFLLSWPVYWWKWNVEVSHYYYIGVCFLLDQLICFKLPGILALSAYTFTIMCINIFLFSWSFTLHNNLLCLLTFLHKNLFDLILRWGHLLLFDFHWYGISFSILLVCVYIIFVGEVCFLQAKNRLSYFFLFHAVSCTFNRKN